MGQKVNPISHRLQQNQSKHKSVWCFKNYGEVIHEDFQIQQFVTDHLLNKNIKLYNTPKIIRSAFSLDIKIIVISDNDIPDFKPLSNILSRKTNKKVSIDYKIIPDPFNNLQNPYLADNAEIIAKYIALEIEQRKNVNQIFKHVLSRAEESYQIEGIKIKCSGRLKGVDMARSEWTSKGRLPLQSFNKNIDYATASAHTIYGLIGVKVWLYLNNKKK